MPTAFESRIASAALLGARARARESLDELLAAAAAAAAVATDADADADSSADLTDGTEADSSDADDGYGDVPFVYPFQWLLRAAPALDAHDSDGDTFALQDQEFAEQFNDALDLSDNGEDTNPTYDRDWLLSVTVTLPVMRTLKE
ncbi:hypothetical protein HK405_013880 [Cladochytrium tenue]|nr:hypothetical protein HK405_013880 [Cladochytrium tenue]